MRKLTRFLIIVLLFSLLLPSIAQASTLGTRTLRQGMEGDDVRALQQLLKKVGYFMPEPTGFFGSVTQASVTNFQRGHGLKADGIAGSETLHTLRYENGVAAQYYAYARLLRRGMTGGDVSTLQEVLKRLGHLPASLNATGFFGAQTETAVINFQQAVSQKVDGIVGQATATALHQALSKLGNVGSGGGSVGTQTYTVVLGDSLWRISHKFNITVAQLQQANRLSSTNIIPGQRLTIPTGTPPSRGDDRPSTPSITYTNYTVRAGDTIWAIALKHGLRDVDVLKANGFTAKTMIYVGQVIKIPVHNIPIKPTPGPQYGELLDWWTKAQYIIKFNVPFTIIDFATGTSFQAVRTYGANHADCEPLTAKDTATMLNLWNKYHTSYWTERPVIIVIEGRRLAASMNAMLHAGLDQFPNGVNVANRSGGYGFGPNMDAIKGNNADGHFCIHFLNSSRHSDGALVTAHQANIRKAAGIK